MLKTRTLVASLAFAVFAIGNASAAPIDRDAHEGDTAEGAQNELAEHAPTALAKHLEAMREAVPIVGEAGNEGSPQSWGDERLTALAYPGTDVTLAEINASRSAFAGIKKRGLPKGQGKTGTWTSIGPSYASMEFFEGRDTTSYIPNATISAGRTNAMAISPGCTATYCRMWVLAAGGGLWRTDKALSGNPVWTYLSTSWEINTGDTIFQDPNDSTGNTLWIGTGEGKGCGDCAFGVGVYKTTNGGNTWSGPLGKSLFNGRAVTTIAVPAGQPNVVYAGVARGSNGIASVAGGGTTTTVPGAALWGLYKSTDGGANWTYVHNGAATVCNVSPATLAANGQACSARGTRRVKVDPVDPNTVYASSFGRGIWRSSDSGATWTQIETPATISTTMRSEFALALQSNGNTRMYVAEGDSGSPASKLYRSDSVRVGAPGFTLLSSSNPADPGFGSYNYCEGQCWYDNYVYSPPGHPDIVYLSGSYAYNENDPYHSDGWISNGRGVVLSQDAGVSFTDQSYDSTDFLHPNGLHPDHQTLITNPANPLQFFDGSDGGLVRSSGVLADISAQCDIRALYGLAGDKLTRCKQLLSAVPTLLQSISKGLTTLQFQSVLINPANVDDLQGGTQDNGTWESYGNPTKWINTMIGDGGQSGFDATQTSYRFHTYYGAQADSNFNFGAVADWNWMSDPLYFQTSSFYMPIIHDPVVSKTLFAGTTGVYRTQTYGMGGMSEADFKTHCNEWTGDFAVTCGDWVRLGPLSLTSSTWGDRSGNYVTATERATSDTSTLWAATASGRVFISKNADNADDTAVSFTRLDDDSAATPSRFVTSIFVDPNDANHAWVTYSGFNIATPTTPGHVFSVQFDPNTSTSSWASVDNNLGDLPVNDIVYDQVRGDLYMANDFGVLRLPFGSSTWSLAAPGMPAVVTPGLSIAPGSRRLIAATHGLGAWRLNLP
jgi:hypothetical protein